MPKVNCDFCGASVMRAKRRIDKCKNFFCNKKCKGDWMRGKFVVDHPVNQYRVIKSAKTKKSMGEHRFVASLVLGRPLNKDEHVHHVNGDKLDNRPENLVILSPSQHASLHNAPTIDVNAVVQLRQDGLTLSEISEVVGIGRRFISNKLQDSGIDTTERFSYWNRDIARILAEDGKSTASISRELGIPESTIRKYFRNHKVQHLDGRTTIIFDWTKIDSMRADGHGIRKIAKLIGCSYGGLRKAMIKTGRHKGNP